MATSLNFYVYAYLREKSSSTSNKGTPYYIGKGRHNRMFNKHYAKPKDNNYIIILENNLTELGAFALERRMIRWYGRKDIGTGILNNQTDGGEGVSGRIFSDETRAKISLALKGKPKSEEHRKKSAKAALGHKHTEEMKRRMSERASQFKHTDTSRLKMSLSQKGKPRTHRVRGIPTQPTIGMRPVCTPDGNFISCAEAGRHYMISKDAVGNRCKSEKYPDWKYL